MRILRRKPSISEWPTAYRADRASSRKQCPIDNDGMKSIPSILDRIGITPLVRLNRVAAGLRLPVLGKCEFLNPGGSVKDRIALAIVDDAERRSLLNPGMTLVEATAGNTGIGLALVAAVRGYRVACVLPAKMSADKRAALTALGAEVIVVPNAPPTSLDNFQNVARKLAQERGWFLTDQFANPANPRIHELTTGPEVLAQTDGRVGAFVCGIGTGGTITGVGRFLLPREMKALSSLSLHVFLRARTGGWTQGRRAP